MRTMDVENFLKLISDRVLWAFEILHLFARTLKTNIMWEALSEQVLYQAFHCSFLLLGRHHPHITEIHPKRNNKEMGCQES